MKLREIFRFEIGQQSRRVSTWLYFAALLGITFQLTREAYAGNARSGGYFLNASFVIATVTLFGSIVGLVVPAAVAGSAAARDAQTRMHPLLYAAPVSKSAYLGGRFLAAFALNALILAAIPAGFLAAVLAPGVEAELIGPFRPAAYLGAYLVLALPNAFIATALLFSMAALSRRAVVSYLGAVLLLVTALLNWQFVAGYLGRWELAKLLDPMGLTAMAELSRVWTPVEKNTRLVGLEGSLLWNRLLWLGFALGVLALTHLRFRFAHPAARAGWSRGAGRPGASGDAPPARRAPIAVPRARRAFGAATRLRQLLAIVGESFREVMVGWGGLALAALAGIRVLVGPELMEHMGVPLFPTTTRLAGVLAHAGDVDRLVVPLLIVFYAGELVWREREAGLSEMADAAPVPEWVSFLGRFLGLALVLVAAQVLMTAAAMLVQLRMGYHDFEVGVYGQVLFGLQLAEYLLFALLALAVHVLVDQKHLGYLVVVMAYGIRVFAAELGIEHNLLVFGSDPGWSYTDMRGFGPFLAPWMWFKLYWAAWTLLLAVAAKLLWRRGTEGGPGSRLRMARRRFTPSAAWAAAVAAGLILTLGGFVFYNTNVLNDYRPASAEAERRAEYERRYGRYAAVPQPRMTGTRLHVEIHPARREVEVRGAYRLVNRSAVPIDTVHVATDADVTTRAVSFSRAATRVLADRELGHQIHVLAQPLRPGDSLEMRFTVRFAPRGFPNHDVDASVAENGTHFEVGDWLPAIGYQRGRELAGVGERRVHGLAPRAAARSLHDAAARWDVTGRERVSVQAVVGTAADQTAVAPGTLRRSWTESGRRYFHYATDAPVPNHYPIFSARYAVHEAAWKDASGQTVQIQVLHHPEHAWNLDRMVRSLQASLDYFTRHFGPYPHRQIRLVEAAGAGVGLRAHPINIRYWEGFALLNPDGDPRGIDFPFAVVAHEVAHQWWGGQVAPADVEGAPLLSESLAWYSAMEVVEETYGPEHLRRLLGLFRESYLTPRARAAVPLLRASDWFQSYRKGPFAMYALREYVGEERVNAALRRLLAKHGPGAPPLPTSLDLYRELRAVTPDSLRYLLHDLFEANTFWEIAAERATAEQTGTGAWRVTLDVQARKVVVDSAGAETGVPMDDLVEVGVFAAADGAGPGEPLYLRMHRVRSGEQRITVTVPGKPARAGIDPRSLLIDVEPGDNVREVIAPRPE
jgi:ABC-2 type transport system permease protein